MRKKKKRKKVRNEESNTYTCITPTGNEFNKMLRDFYTSTVNFSFFLFV